MSLAFLPPSALGRSGLLLLLALACPASATNAPTLKTLHSYWGARHGDSLTTTETRVSSAAALHGYRLIRKEGTIFGRSLPGTRELVLYRHPEQGRHVLVAHPESRKAAEAAGHVQLRSEGFVLSGQDAGTRPLELYWHPQDKDYLTTASPAGARSARATGYRLVRVEGWLPAETPASPPGGQAEWRKELAAAIAEDHEALSLYWNAERSDYLTAGATHRAPGYTLQGTVAWVRPGAAAGVTRALQLFWHEEREDHLLVASPDGILGAELLGYEKVATVGHALSSAGPGTVPLKLYWNASRQDYLSVPEGSAGVDLSGYHVVRTEAHVFLPQAR